MRLPDPQTSKLALVVGGAFGLGYIIRQGMDHSADMTASDKRRLGIGLMLLSAASIAYHYAPPPWETP